MIYALQVCSFAFRWVECSNGTTSLGSQVTKIGLPESRYLELWIILSFSFDTVPQRNLALFRERVGPSARHGCSESPKLKIVRPLPLLCPSHSNVTRAVIFTGRMLSALEAWDWGTSRVLLLPVPLIISKNLGLVDYVSDPEITAFDRALTLATTISANGISFSLFLFIPILYICSPARPARGETSYIAV